MMLGAGACFVMARGLVAALTWVAVLMAATTSLAQNMQQATKVDIRMETDLSIEETIRTETTPLVQSVVSNAAQVRWEVPGNQTVELVEAFTRKPDGRTIPADVRDLVTQDGVAGQTTSFVDMKVQQIPLRDVGVGDTTVVTLRFKESQHYIPGQFSQRGPFCQEGRREALTSRCECRRRWSCTTTRRILSRSTP